MTQTGPLQWRTGAGWLVLLGGGRWEDNEIIHSQAISAISDESPIAFLPAAVLGLAHIILASHAMSLQRGYRWTASARDEPSPPATGFAGRLERANRNFTETFVFFAAGIFFVYATNAESPVTAWAAWVYVAARAAYLIAYAGGVFLVRSLIWNVGTLAIVTLLLAPFARLWWGA